jgi:arginase family enzyme
MTVFPMEAVESEGIERITEQARAIVTAEARLYISVDIDDADRPSPGANSPKPDGLKALEIIRGVRNRGA